MMSSLDGSIISYITHLRSFEVCLLRAHVRVLPHKHMQSCSLGFMFVRLCVLPEHSI